MICAEVSQGLSSRVEAKTNTKCKYQPCIQGGRMRFGWASENCGIHDRRSTSIDYRKREAKEVLGIGRGWSSSSRATSSITRGEIGRLSPAISGRGTLPVILVDLWRCRHCQLVYGRLSRVIRVQQSKRTAKNKKASRGRNQINNRGR